MIDLKKFCASDFEPLSEPFTVGEYTYASNGHVCVRVQKTDGISRTAPEGMNVEELTYFDSEGVYKELPKYIPAEKIRCGTCSGSGFSSKCPECEGDGVVVFSNDFHEYECDCDTCHGDGITVGGKDKCKRCDGTGLVNKERFPFVDVDELRINTNLLDMIKGLPSVKLNTSSKKEYAMFSFDGGVGLVMGMRKDDDDD